MWTDSQETRELLCPAEAGDAEAINDLMDGPAPGISQREAQPEDRPSDCSRVLWVRGHATEPACYSEFRAAL
jgi:hypothetical protein